MQLRHPDSDIMENESSAEAESSLSDETTNSETDESSQQEAAPLAETFEEIVQSDSLLGSIRNLGFTKPTDVQAQAVPPGITGHDLIVQAQTGSGKTLSYVLPLLSRLEEAESKGPVNKTFALVVVPTRELATQVVDVVCSMRSDISPTVIIGGVSSSAQIKSLNADGRVVVGTPGRLLDLIRQKKLSLRHCRYFVLDEADEMLSMGFLEDVRAILSRLPDKRQGMFVSATISGRVRVLANSFLTKPLSIEVDESKKELPPIEHLFCNVAGDLMAKPTALCDLIETERPRSAIIFCNTKSDTQLVEVLLRRRGFDARRINSDLTQSQRDKIMDKIRAGELQLLVGTDIAARGLDLDQIDLVVNYAIHDQPDTYIHRTGRTGRAGRSGRAISLVGPRDFGAFHFLQKVVKADFKEMELPSDEDVANARLAHMYEIIRSSKIELQERDLVVARKLLQELGGDGDHSEEMEQMLAKLCRSVLEHAIAHEAKSLDEELESDGSRGSRSSDSKRDRGTDRRRERDTRGESRGDRERSKHDGREDSERPRSDHWFLNKLGRGDVVRLYLGQGSSQGMTRDEFVHLVTEFAEIDQKYLKNIIIRDKYGYADVSPRDAVRLIETLNGIEYNGAALPVEFATVLVREQRRDNQNRGRGGGGGRGRRNDRGPRRDSRGGGGRGRERSNRRDRRR